jgi:PAS domain S-box-containing protein
MSGPAARGGTPDGTPDAALDRCVAGSADWDARMRAGRTAKAKDASMPADPARGAARPLCAAAAALSGLTAAAGLWALEQTAAALPVALMALAGLVAVLAALGAIARETAGLRRRADQFRGALEALPDGLLVCDAEDRVVYYNDRYPEHVMPVLARELAIGRRFAEMLRAALARGPIYHAEMGAAFAEDRLAMRGLDHSDHVQRLHDGRWLRIRESRAPGGGRVLLTQEVTEERRRAQELRLLAAAVEQVGDPVEITDARRVFTYVNHAFETTTGWRPEEALGREPQELLSSGVQPQAFFDDMARTLESGSTWHGTIINRHRDGHLIEQETTISPLRDPRGVITHYVAVKRDVSEARAQARALAESEARYRAVINAQTEYILRVDPSGRWTLMNEAAERYVGLTLAEVRARGLMDHDFVVPEDQPLFHAHIARITPDHPTDTVELRGRRPDGRVTWEQWTDTGIFDAEGRLLEIQCVGREIADRKQAEAARDEAERLRRDALEAALDCYIGMDADGRIVEFNAAAERTFGHARGQAIGRPMAELIVPPALRQAHAAGLARHLATGESRILGRRIEVDAMRADGGVFPIEMVIVKGEREAGTIYLAYLRDLSERRAAEKALLDSEAQFRAIAEALPVGVMISDIGSGRPVFINRKAREQLDLADGELRETMRDIWADPADRDRLLAELRANGGVDGFEADLILPNGREVTALFSATRVSYGGQPALLTATVDITDLRRAEAELRASEARLNAIIAANPVALNIARLSDRRLLFVNEPYLRMYGLEALDLDVFDRNRLYADPAERDFIYREIAEGREVTNFELMLKRTDGTEVPTSLTSRRILFQGEPALVTSSIDLTELRLAQAEAARSREALHQSEKLNALGALLAGVAHELNNPLSVVVGYSSMLMDLDIDPAIAARVEKIHAAAERCGRIVRTFLAMARAREPRRGPVSLCDVTIGALDLAGYGLRSADVQVTMDVACALPEVQGDADQLHQVVVNLIVNAQQALLGRAAPRRLDVRGWAANGEAVLEIADNGPGMAAEVAKRAFEPFFTTKPQGVGTGVGLAVCHGIIAAHGGRIELDTAPGAGARFRLHLPLAARPAAAAPDAAAAPVGRGRVLVVDDEPEIAGLLAERLRAEGIEVATASSGRRALALLEGGGFDAVISDLRMPDIDGAALATEIAGRWPALARRMLLITGDTLGADADRRLGALGLAVFEKPLDLGALTAELRRRLAEKDPA